MNLPSVTSDLNPDSSDQELLELFVSERDEVAFAQLVQRHQKMVMRIASSRVPNSDLVKDVVQEVFIQLARKSAALVDHPSIKSWLARAAVLESKKAVRKEVSRSKRQKEFVEKSELESPRFSDSAFGELERVLPKLSVQDRRVIELRYSGGRSFEEIGLELKKSPAAAQRMVSRAIAKLRGLVSRDGLDLAVAGSLGPALMAYFSGKCSASGAVGLVAGEGGGSAVAGGFTAGSKGGILWALSILAAVLAVLLGLVKTSEVERKLSAANKGMFSRSIESSRRVSRSISGGVTHEWLTTSLFEDVLQAYLAGDFQQVSTNRGLIELMRSEELEDLHAELLRRPEQGTPAALLRQSIRKVLWTRYPEEAGRILTQQAMEARKLEEAIDPCFRWASEEPMEALEWYLESRDTNEIQNRRLWVRRKNDWLREKVRRAYKPPAGLGFTQTMNWGSRELIDFDVSLVASLFHGMATSDLGLAVSSLERISEDDLRGAMLGIGRYASLDRRHREFGEIVMEYVEMLEPERVFRDYIRCLEKIPNSFEKDLVALHEMVSGSSLAQESVIRLMVHYLGFTRPSHFDFADQWILKNVPEGMQREQLAKVFVRWNSKDAEELRDWILNRNSLLHEHAAFEAFTAILEGEEPLTRARAELLLSALTDAELKAAGHELFEQKYPLSK
jgi:RNA polymerase sigma factor (sigma-70 family)